MSTRDFGNLLVNISIEYNDGFTSYREQQYWLSYYTTMY